MLSDDDLPDQIGTRVRERAPSPVEAPDQHRGRVRRQQRPERVGHVRIATAGTGRLDPHPDEQLFGGGDQACTAGRSGGHGVREL